MARVTVRFDNRAGLGLDAAGKLELEAITRCCVPIDADGDAAELVGLGNDRSRAFKTLAGCEPGEVVYVAFEREVGTAMGGAWYRGEVVQ